MSETNFGIMSADDWKKINMLTAQDTDDAIVSDPDSQTPDDEVGAWQGNWQLKNGDQQIILPLAVDAKTANIISEKHIDYQVLLSGILKFYVENHFESGNKK